MRDLRHTSIEALLAERDFIRNLARSLVRESDVADEIAQQSWVAAWRSRERPLGALRPWLTAITRNLVFRSHRDASRRRRREEKAARSEALRATDEVAMRVELERDLAEAVLRLPGLERDLIGLRFYEGLSLREASRRLEVPYTTAHRTLESALERLRQVLAERYGDRKSWGVAIAALAAPSDGAVTRTLRSRPALKGVFTMMAVSSVALIVWTFATTGSWLEESEEQLARVEAGLELVASPERSEASGGNARPGSLPPLGARPVGDGPTITGAQAVASASQSEEPEEVLAERALPGVRIRCEIPEAERELEWKAFCCRMPEEGPIRDEHELHVAASRQRSVDLEEPHRELSFLDLEPGEYQVGLFREGRLAKVEGITVEASIVEREWKIAALARSQVIEVELRDSEGVRPMEARWDVHFDSRPGPTGFTKRTPLEKGPGKVWLLSPMEADAILSKETDGQVWVSAKFEGRRRMAELLPGDRRAELVFGDDCELIVEVTDVPADAERVTVFVAGGGEDFELGLGGAVPVQAGRAALSLPPGRYDVWAECLRQGGRIDSESEIVQISLSDGGSQASVRLVPAHSVVLELPEGHPRSILDVQNLETGAVRRYTVSEGHERWLLQRLPAGRYRITLEGLEPAIVDVPLRRGRLRLQ